MTDDTMTDGWCDDCDTRSVVVDADGSAAWATCTECGVGWIHRDEPVDTSDLVGPAAGRRAA